MALKAVEQLGRSTSVGYAGEGVTAERIYHVISPERIFGFDMVYGLPEVGEPYPQYSGQNLLCTHVTAKEEEKTSDGKYLWIVTAHYGTVGINGQMPALTPPLSRSPAMTTDSRLVEMPVTIDLDGKSYINPAGDPYLDPPPTITEPHDILSVTSNMSTNEYSGAWRQSWLNKVNSDAWQGGAKDTVLIERISAQMQFEEYYFWRVTMEFHFNPRKWIPTKIPARGPSYLTWPDGYSADPKKHYAEDAGGNKSTEPVWLDAVGQKISEKDLRDGTVEPYYQEFREYEYANFSLLGF